MALGCGGARALKLAALQWATVAMVLLILAALYCESRRTGTQTRFSDWMGARQASTAAPAVAAPAAATSSPPPAVVAFATDGDSAKEGLVPRAPHTKIPAAQLERDEVTSVNEYLRRRKGPARDERQRWAGAFWHKGRCWHSLHSFPECPGTKALPLLVTGTGRSGTHFIAESLKSHGVHACHEYPCDEGAISWTHAVVARHYPYEYKHLLAGRRFARIFHIVRHPLKAIASITTFVPRSWHFIAMHTPSVPKLNTIQPVQLRAMIHWVTWNNMVRATADRAYRLEKLSVHALCVDAGFPDRVCAGEELGRERDSLMKRGVRKHRRLHDSLSWDDLYLLDVEWAQATFALAKEFGYEEHASTIDDVLTTPR